MKQRVQVIDRKTQNCFIEKIWGEGALHFLYGDSFLSKFFGRFFLQLIVRWPFFSYLVGKFYDSSWSRKTITPFCTQFDIDMKECVETHFRSFNDFFVRRPQPGGRPQDQSPSIVTMPADGRYSFFPTIGVDQPFVVKEESFSLEKLLGSKALAARFVGGVAVLARLCPSDCHRFYFPVDASPSEPIWIPGSLFSVSPIATRTRPWIWWTNRRVITLLETEQLGAVAYMEVGATNCGSIVQNFVPGSWVKKGQEKGFFRIGGSALILLFEPQKIQLMPDLLALSLKQEVYCQIGQPLGRILS